MRYFEDGKRVAKNSIFLYLRMMLVMSVSLYTSRVILKTIGITDYGVYNVVGGIVAMFSFINNSMISATQRFITFELGKEHPKMNQVFSSTIMVHILLSIIVFLLAETVGLYLFYNYLKIPESRLWAAQVVYQISIASCIVMVMSVPYNALIVANEKMNVYAYISVVEVVLKLLVVYCLNLLEYDKLVVYAILIFLVQLIIRYLYTRYSKAKFENVKFEFSFVEKERVQNLFSFAGWSFLGNLAVVGYTQGLNILLNFFFGPTVNAARGLAVQVQQSLRTFCASFQTAVNPQITKSYAAGDINYMHSLIVKSSKLSFFLMMLAAVPLIIETPLILKVWLTEVPEHTMNFLRLIILISLIDTLSNPLLISVQATGRIRNYQIIISSILLLILPISYVILKISSVPELVFAVHLFIDLFAQIIRVKLLTKNIGLKLNRYIRNVIFPIVSVSIVSILIPTALHYMISNDLLDFFLVVFSWIICFVLCVYFIGLNTNERLLLLDIIRKKVFKHEKN